MNLQELRYLVAVAEQRHFGRAAEICNVSQPTLSSQVRKLEEELGVTLLERTNKRVALTPVGAQIVEHAQRALKEAGQMEAVARAAKDPLLGPLKLGVIPTLAPYLLPLIFKPAQTAVSGLDDRVVGGPDEGAGGGPAQSPARRCSARHRIGTRPRSPS